MRHMIFAAAFLLEVVVLGADLRQATAVATVTAGYVTGITLTFGGSGYTSAPVVIMTGGGGSGAEAKAILNGDAVASLIVLNAGNGYSSAPTITIEAPPKPTSLRIEFVPKITVLGQSGSTHRIEWSPTMGPEAVWQFLTNVTVGTDGVTAVDLASGSTVRFYRAIYDLLAPFGMVPINAGSFEMGDMFYEGTSWDVPVHSVYLSPFAIDQYEVSKGLWDGVRIWSRDNGYDLPDGVGKALNHPVTRVNWYDAVKWCNARSEKQGRVAAYYTDKALTQVYRTGEKMPYVKWDGGYRLPTEAEWEKSARGGSSGHRFSWTNSDTISHARANYFSSTGNAYDISPTRGFHPTYAGTSPVGSFAANGYGLYDTVGNVAEWCWDKWGSYPSGPQTDPRGPDVSSTTAHIVRGGSWSLAAALARSAFRSFEETSSRQGDVGFRSVLPLVQP